MTAVLFGSGPAGVFRDCLDAGAYGLSSRLSCLLAWFASERQSEAKPSSVNRPTASMLVRAIASHCSAFARHLSEDNTRAQ